MHALSVRQPYAEQIASGAKRREYRTWKADTVIGNDLLIVSSRKAEPGGEALPLGVAICVVRVERIEETADGFAWVLSMVRRVEAFPVKGCASLFKVDDAKITNVARTRAIAMAKREREIDRSEAPPNYALTASGRVITTKISNAKEARERAAAMAERNGVPIAIECDGFETSSVGPKHVTTHRYTFAIGALPLDGGEDSEEEALTAARFLSALYFDAPVTIHLDGKPIGEPIKVSE